MECYTTQDFKRIKINLEKKKELEIGGDLLETGAKGGDCDEPRYVEENCCHHNLQVQIQIHINRNIQIQIHTNSYVEKIKQ